MRTSRVDRLFDHSEKSRSYENSHMQLSMRRSKADKPLIWSTILELLILET
jgi:hypothetical protein